MVSIAKQNLFHQKGKSVMSICGVILSVFLIFTIYGVYNGMNSVMDSLIFGTNADLWITQEGTSGSLHSPSIISMQIENQLGAIEGVEELSPIIRTAIIYSSDGGDILLLLNGINISGSLGKPWNVVEGVSTLKPNEVIIDKVFSKKVGLSIGDNITLKSNEFRIVGFSDKTNIMIGYIVFISFKDARNFLPSNFTNGFLIKVEESASISVVKTNIQETIDQIEVKDSFEIAEAYKDEVLGSFIPIIFILSAIALFVGILIIALLIYMITLEKSKEYGIIKAIGATNFFLYRVVLSQSIIISVIGYILGVVISYPLIDLIEYFVPEFLVVISVDMVIWGFPLFLSTGIIASVIPVKKIISIDPAMVFK